MKDKVKKIIGVFINRLGIGIKFRGIPKGVIQTEDWCIKNNAPLINIYNSKVVKQNAPATLDEKVHILYRQEYVRTQNNAFVAIIEQGKVWGRNGAVITPDNLLLSDVSREFGQYGGVIGFKHSIFKQLKKLSIVKYLDATVAVLASAGANNFHHWMYDNVPRFHLIEKAGIAANIDYYVFDRMDLPYQNEIIKLLGIREEQILNCHNNWNFHIRAKKLIVPSLPSRLNVISDWTVEYLRNLLLPNNNNKITIPNKRIYISRKKAPTRKIINEANLLNLLTQNGFIEYFAEDHSITETASLFNQAEFIIGIHGSGLSNLAFAAKGVKVIDIVAPKHIDTYYWILSYLREGVYGYITGNGDFDTEQNELVKTKIDKDIELDIELFTQLFNEINKQQKNVS